MKTWVGAQGWTPTWRAAASGHLPALRVLARHGADLARAPTTGIFEVREPPRASEEQHEEQRGVVVRLRGALSEALREARGGGAGREVSCTCVWCLERWWCGGKKCGEGHCVRVLREVRHQREVGKNRRRKKCDAQ